MWCEKWNAAQDMSNYVSQRAAQVMMSPLSDNMDAVETVLQTTLTTLQVLEGLEFDDCFPSSLLPPPYVAPPWTSQDLLVFMGTGDDVSSGCGKSAGKGESDGCGKRPRLQLRSEHVKVYSAADSVPGNFDKDDESKGGKYELKCLPAETVANGCNLMCTPEASEQVIIGGCNIPVQLSTAARVASESPPGIPLLSMLFLQPGASLTRLAAKQTLLLDRIRHEDFKTGVIQCPADEDEDAALIPHFGDAKVCDVGARCDPDSAGGTFSHHDDSTHKDSDCFSRGDCNEGSYYFSGGHESGKDTCTDFGSKPTEFVLSQLSACQMGKLEPASLQPGETLLELGQYTTSLNQLDRCRPGLSQGQQDKCHSGQCQLNQSLDWCLQVAVTTGPEADRPVTAPGEMVQVITPGPTVPASAISESRLAGHSSVNVSIGLVSDGSEPAEPATVSVKSSGLELVSAGLKPSRSVFDGTLPVHDILGSVTDPITTDPITMDQGSNSSPDRSGCSVLVGPTRKGSSRPRSKTIPWQLQTLLMTPWLDRSSVRILIMVLLFFILNLSFPSYSTTPYFLLACAFNLHHITNNQSILRLRGSSERCPGDGAEINRGARGWSRFRADVCGASSSNSMYGVTKDRVDDICGVSRDYDGVYSSMDPGPTKGSDANFCAGMASNQGTVCLLGLCTSLMAFLEASFGYIFSVSTVLPTLLFSVFYAHFIKRWYTKKGVRLKPEKEPNELDTLFRASGTKLLQRDSNKVSWKAAGTPEKNIPFFSVIFLVLAVMLGDGGKSISRLDVAAGIRSGSWVGGAERGSQLHHRCGSCYMHGRSGLKGRIDFSVGNADNWIENAPPGTRSWRRRMHHQAQGARDGGCSSGGVGGGGGGGGSGGGSSCCSSEGRGSDYDGSAGGGDGGSEGSEGEGRDGYGEYGGGSGNPDTAQEQADSSRNRCRKEGNYCRRERNGSNNGQERSIIGAGQLAQSGHDQNGHGSLSGVVGRTGGRRTGRTEHEWSWTGVISAGITEGTYVGPRPLRRGQTFGFDKDNPGRHVKELVRPQQQEERMCTVTVKCRRKHERT